MTGGLPDSGAGRCSGGKQEHPKLGDPQRILVIRRNRMGDMICTLPLLHALRRRFPQAHLAVACDAPGGPLARACPLVDETILLKTGGLPPFTFYENVRRLRGFDLVIAAKGGFHRRLARLTKFSRGTRGVGFVEPGGSNWYTDPVAAPPRGEHQIETLLRLLGPLGIEPVPFSSDQMRIEVPRTSREFASRLLEQSGLNEFAGLVLINLSSTSPLRFQPDDFRELTDRLLSETQFAIGFVAAPADIAKATALAAQVSSPRVIVLPTPGSMELAALLERAALLVTPEGGAAHLAATVGAPAVVLWSEGPFGKWRSRGENHVFVQAARKEKRIPVERVWETIKPLLVSAKI